MVLITVDTLRADRLGAFGHPAGASPWIDRLGREGILFEQAIAPSCFTAPSMATLSSGLDPMTHGVLEWGRKGADVERTAAEAFRDAGYRTGFFSAHGALASIVAVTRGFDVVSDEGDAPAARLTERALEWVDEGGTAPFFLWIHYFEPHAPYEPAPEDATRFLPQGASDSIPDYLPPDAWRLELERRLRADPAAAADWLPGLYDGEVAEVDRAIGRVAERLESDRWRDRSILAMTADHGENHADHEPYFDHRNYLFDSLVHVPMLVWFPGRRGEIGGRIREPVGIRGLLPSMLALAGIRDETFDPDGTSFVVGVRETEGGGLEPELRFGHDGVFVDSGLQEQPHKGIRSRDTKLTLSLSDGRYLVYDLRADPGETSPRALSEADERGQEMRDRLDTWIERARGTRTADPAMLDDQERRRLEALGYFPRSEGDSPR